MFVGTVTDVAELDEREMKSVEDHFLSRRVTLKVGEVFSGKVGDKVQVRTGSGETDCGYSFQVGQTYLVDAGESEGTLTTSVCSLTQPVESAHALIEQFRKQNSGVRPPSVSGTVSEHVFDPFTFDTLVYRSLPNMLVKVQSETGTFETKTDAKGNYKFEQLPPGKYVVTADLTPGIRLRPYIGENTFTLGADGCVVHNMEATPSGKIEGIIVDKTGAPIHAAAVLNKGGPLLPRTRPENSAPVDRDGHFAFYALPDGDYRVDIRAEAPEQPHAPKTVLHAEFQSHIRGGQSVDLGSITPKPWDAPYVLRVVVTWADGKPATAARLYPLKEPAEGKPLEGENQIVDGQGRATMRLTHEYWYGIVADVTCADGSHRRSARTQVGGIYNSDVVELPVTLTGDRCAEAK